MRIAFALALAFGLPAVFYLAAAATQAPPLAPNAVRIVGDAGRGEQLAGRWCASCHLPSSTGSVSDAAPTFHWIGALARKNPESVRTFLSHPHAPMPPLELDRGQIEDLVAYFRSLAD